jgi:PTS system N-acetylgalactosamine-specific IIA component
MTSDGTPAAAPAHVAIVAAHGELAAGLVSAVAQITGRSELLVPLSNTGCSPADIEQRMRAAAEESSVRAVFTDLPAGSCTIAARRLLRDRPDLVLVTGVNLATLVDFVCRVQADAADGVGDGARGVRAVLDAAAERGRTALGVVAAATAAAPGASHGR